MNRRNFLRLSPIACTTVLPFVTKWEATPLAPPSPQSAFQGEKSKLKITSLRLVQAKPRRPVPTYTPAPGSFSPNESEVANPMCIYPEYKAKRSLFYPDPGQLAGFTVEIATDKGVKGYGSGGIAGGPIVEKHLTKLLLGEDPSMSKNSGTSSGAPLCATAEWGPSSMRSAAWIWHCGT